MLMPFRTIRNVDAKQAVQIEEYNYLSGIQYARISK